MARKLDASQSKQRFQKGVSTVNGIPAGHDDTIHLAVALQNFTDALLGNSLQFIDGINEILAMLDRIMPGSDKIKVANKLNNSNPSSASSTGCRWYSKFGLATTMRYVSVQQCSISPTLCLRTTLSLSKGSTISWHNSKSSKPLPRWTSSGERWSDGSA